MNCRLSDQSDTEISDYCSDGNIEDGYDELMLDLETQMRDSLQNIIKQGLEYLKKKKSNMMKDQ